MIKSYQLEKRIINNFLFLIGKKVTFVIYSPQRSFSNFFSQLIELNLFLHYEKGKKNINYYKHNPKVSLDLNLKKKYIVFVLYKEFDLWHQSLKKNPMDFFQMFKKFDLPHMTIKDKKKLKNYHFDFFNFWLKNSNKIKNLEFINFREILVERNILEILDYIKTKYKLFSKSKKTIPTKVRFSKKFNKNKINKTNPDKSILSKKINCMIEIKRKLLINNF